MSFPKRPFSELCAPFCFTESSRWLRLVRSHLLVGTSVVVLPVDLNGSAGYLIQFYPKEEWSIEAIIELSDHEEDHGFGKNELHGLAVHLLGSDNHESRLIDATLSAGSSVYLVADHQASGQVVRHYILRTSISDNF